MPLDWYPLRPQVRLRHFRGTPLGYCIFAGLCDFAFDNGGLPTDARKAAILCELDFDLVKQVWDEFKAVCSLMPNGRLMPREIIEAEGKINAVRQKRKDAGREGGIQSGLARTGQRDGFDAPFNSENGQSSHKLDGSLSNALEAIFPSEIGQRRFLQLAAAVTQSNATVEQVNAWPEWYRFRYPRNSKTVFKFIETISEFVNEPVKLPIGARFIIACSFNLDANEHRRLTKDQFNIALNQGELLEDLVREPDINKWRERRLLPVRFQEFFKQRVTDKGFPSGESIVKHWPAFIEWLAKQPS